MKLRALLGCSAVAAGLTLGVISMPSGTAVAQDDEGGLPTASHRENVTYYRVYYVAFKQGHENDAWAIMYGKFQPASEAAGRRFVALDFDAGPWDSAIYIPLDGYADLEWTLTPQGEKFWAALAAQEGGADKARAVFDEWNGYIANSVQTIAHMHMPPQDDSGE